jgi:protoheme IX farnesyltransferase
MGPVVRVAPERTIGTLLRDYSELIKLRVTSLIVLSAWAGAYFASARSGAAQLSWAVLHTVIGVALIAGGSAALNEVVERDVDALMRRTAHRPLPSRRMGLVHASALAGGVSVLRAKALRLAPL